MLEVDRGFMIDLTFQSEFRIVELAFSRIYRAWNDEDWSRLLFSDE